MSLPSVYSLKDVNDPSHAGFLNWKSAQTISQIQEAHHQSSDQRCLEGTLRCGTLKRGLDGTIEGEFSQKICRTC
jgi:hypothetical protein